MSDDGVAGQRSRRARNVGKVDKLSELQKLKENKKSGHRLEVPDEKDLFEYVDEETYAKIREERIRQNIGDEDPDYYDDGDEYFDEEEPIKKQSKLSKLKKDSQGKCDVNKNVKSEKTNQNILQYLHKDKKEKPTATDNETVDEIIASIGMFNNKTSKNVHKRCSDSVFADKNFNSPKKAKINTSKKPKEYKKPVKKLSVSNTIKIKSNTSYGFVDESIDYVEQSDSNKCNVEKHKDIIHKKLEEFKDDNDTFFEEMNIDDLEVNNINKSEQRSDFTKESNESTILFDDVEMDDDNKLTTDYSKEFDADKCVYWLDAYEDAKISGTIFIFGKKCDRTQKKFSNCTIRITNMERRLYFLKRSGASDVDVYKEVNELLSTYKIERFRAMPIVKKYAFDIIDVPDIGNYLLVLYDAKLPILPIHLKGKSFSHVFGTHTSCLENFILDKKLKGPCWLLFDKIKPSEREFSNSELNFDCDNQKMIQKIFSQPPSPLVCMMSLNVKTMINQKTNVNEILSVACFVNSKVGLDQPPPKRNQMHTEHFALVCPPRDGTMPLDAVQQVAKLGSDIKIHNSEKALINNLLAKIRQIDPDIIVGHSLFGHLLPIIIQRCAALDIAGWDKLGRLQRRIQIPKSGSGGGMWMERTVTAGRLICDTMFSAQQLVKCRSYELRDLIKELLPNFPEICVPCTAHNMDHFFIRPGGVHDLVKLTMEESIVNHHLIHHLQILPLSLQITSICGNLMSKTLSSGRSAQNEYLLLHAFSEQDYINPDKPIINEKNENENMDKKAKYSGGLVLEPKVGLYDSYILLMDFNSLYPSIILEYNICFTTMDRRKYLSMSSSSGDSDEGLSAQKMALLMKMTDESRTKSQGILPSEIKKLVDSRREVKKLLQDPKLGSDKQMQYDIRQKALKITANSMYGCLGFSGSRFQATQLAELITCEGREILKRTKSLVESGSLKIHDSPEGISIDIVYGDTDSIMINTGMNAIDDYSKVLRIGKQIKDEVNKISQHIQLDIDGVFRKLLLLKKKKYAALTVIRQDPQTLRLETKQELKGLDIVRRDWCRLATVVGRRVVAMLLEVGINDQKAEEDLVESVHAYLRTVAADINSDKMQLDNFIITKQLARNPESYQNTAGQSHVIVALRINKTGSVKTYRAKDTVEYVVCLNGTTDSYTKRAYTLDEIRSSMNTQNRLLVDKEYYLKHQLQPVISRLIEHVSGMTSATVAEALGLDPKIFTGRAIVDKNDDNGGEDVTILFGSNRYNECKPLEIGPCRKCNVMVELFSTSSVDRLLSIKCVKCGTPVWNDLTEMRWKLINLVHITIRRYIRNYYLSRCNDDDCKYISQVIPGNCSTKFSKAFTRLGQQICVHCGDDVSVPVISANELYYQLRFFDHLFSKDDGPIAQEVRQVVNSYLCLSKYSKVDLGELFSSIKIK